MLTCIPYFQFDAFSTTQKKERDFNDSAKTDCRETNENQSRRQKGIDRIKLIADGLRLKGTEKKAMQ